MSGTERNGLFGFVERHPWGCLLIGFAMRIPISMAGKLTGSYELRLLAELVFVIGVACVVLGYFLRFRRRRIAGRSH